MSVFRTASLFSWLCAVTLLAGCGETWTVRDVGRGMQLGSMSGNGWWLTPIVWGAGFVIEQVGDIFGGNRTVTPPKVEPLEGGDQKIAPQPDSRPVD